MKNLITRAETMKKLFSVRLVLAATLSLMLFGDLAAQQVPDATRLRQEQQDKVDDIFISFNRILVSVKTLTDERGLERLGDLIAFVQLQFLTDTSKELAKKLLAFEMSLSGGYDLKPTKVVLAVPSTFTNAGGAFACGPFSITYTNLTFGTDGYSAEANLKFNISEADMLVNQILDQFILILAKLEDELEALVQFPTLEESHEQMFRFNLVSVPYLEAIIEGLGQDPCW